MERITSKEYWQSVDEKYSHIPFLRELREREDVEYEERRLLDRLDRQGLMSGWIPKPTECPWRFMFDDVPIS